MSILGGLGGGGSSVTYTPQAAPMVPLRGDVEGTTRTYNFYKSLLTPTYNRASKAGGAPAPTKSYAAGLFSSSGASGI